MRKLTLMATSAVVACAFAAFAAAPAQADKPFQIVDPSGIPCDLVGPGYCDDTGREGTFDIVNNAGVLLDRCDVEFDLHVQVNGALDTYNTAISCIYGSGATVCDDSWSGQLRVPDTGAPKLDLEMCISGTTNTVPLTLAPQFWYMTGSIPFTASWQLKNPAIESTYNADNPRIELL